MTRAPIAANRAAVARPMLPMPTTRTVIWNTCFMAQRGDQYRASCWRRRRGRSLAPARTPNRANSASVSAWAPAEVVNSTGAISSALRPDARTCDPPPAAIVCTQRRRGLARTVRASWAGLVSGMP